MSTWWSLWILMGCKILHTFSTSTDGPKVVYVPAGGRVSVPCSNPSNNEVKFTLSKNGESLHSHTINSVSNTTDGPPRSNTVGVEFKGPENGSYSFVLPGANACTQGIYRCEGTVTFPPPLRSLPSTTTVVLLVEEHQCSNGTDKSPEGEGTSGSDWLWILTLMVSTYGVAVTIGAVFIWVKWRKDDSQSAYVNTNPKTTRSKGRLYNPKPHFFYAPD